MIPQNSKLFGTYNSSISYSQSRVQIGWHTLIRPDGYQINLGNMTATDPQGAAGIKGVINDHPLAYIKAIGLMSVFNIVGREYSSQLQNTSNPYVQDLIANSTEVTTKMGEKLIDRALNVQPTIRIKEGTRINIVVNQTVYLPPLDPYKVSMRYNR
jgi:type IV secretion system protein VirB10